MLPIYGKKQLCLKINRSTVTENVSLPDKGLSWWWKKRQEDLAIAQEQWEEDAENNRIEVTEDNVADVVSMMSGIPVNRIAQQKVTNWQITRTHWRKSYWPKRSGDENCAFKGIVPEKIRIVQ
jgi:ATP-dependent Clp protease ATP-binding subunit ClpA